MTDADYLEVIRETTDALATLQERFDAHLAREQEALAVVGWACRFPAEANGLAQFWSALMAGTDGVTAVPDGRWDVDALHDPDPDAVSRWRMYTREIGSLRDVDGFDAAFFRIAPLDAERMDPQLRLLHEVAWEAFEDACLDPAQLSGSATGVFIGLMNDDYQGGLRHGGEGAGMTRAGAAGRLSYTFGLRGPSMVIDTACSSSLVALHLACKSLRDGECSLAVVGGVNLILGPGNMIGCCAMRALSPSGRCRTFDAGADGYTRGEGCGVIVLERASLARAAGRHIHGLVLGSAVNQDGRSANPTAPHGPAQEAVIRAALRAAGVEAHEVGYVEAHGTATPLGDPIELTALSAVYGEGRDAALPLWVGSLKTNFGHLESAAGIAGLIKALLVVAQREIPPHLHLREPNPRVPWSDLPLAVPRARVPFPDYEHAYAGVSSFGMAGTNVHVIVGAEAPARDDDELDVAAVPSATLLTLAARSEASLAALARSYAEHLERHPDQRLCDVAHAAAHPVRLHRHRLAIVARDRDQLRARLLQAAERREDAWVARGDGEALPLAFMFPGQGAQYPRMAEQLYRTSRLFREQFERCAEVARPALGVSLMDMLYDASADPARIDETVHAQPLLYALSWSLACLWRSLGVEPTHVIGHSVGEYVAAAVAGVFDVESGMRLVCARGSSMWELCQRGAMLGVQASASRIEPLLAGRELCIAAYNAEEQLVVAGGAHEVEVLASELSAQRIRVQRLSVSHAFHSPMMEPMLPAFAREAARVHYQEPQLGFVSNVSGALATREVASAAYWTKHVCAPVRFAQGVRALADASVPAFVELGPHVTLSALAKAGVPDALHLSSLRRGRDDWEHLLTSAAQLHVRGASVDVRPLYAGARHVSLPSYAWDHKSFPIATTSERAEVVTPSTCKPVRVPLALDAAVFEAQVSAAQPGFLADHRLNGQAVFPGTAFLEFARACAAQYFGSDQVVLEGASIERALTLSEQAVRVQAIVQPEGERQARLTLHSAADDGSWTVHFRAITRVDASPPASVSLAALRARIAEPLDVLALRASHAVSYGPTFAGLRGLWRNDREALARAELPSALAGDQGYALHPALLDACWQAAGALIETIPGGDPKFPVGFDRCRWAGGATQLWAWLERGASDGMLDLRVFDDRGKTVCAIDGLTFRSASLARMLGEDPRRCSYTLGWHALPSLSVAPEPARGEHWLLTGDDAGLAQPFAARLRELGRSFAHTGSTQAHRRATHVVYFAPAARAATPERRAVRACAELLELAQELTRDSQQPSRLVLVTQAAYSVAGDRVDAGQAALGGLSRVLTAEHPELRVCQLDFESTLSASGVAEACDAIVAELATRKEERELAYRGGRRFAARLARAPAHAPRRCAFHEGSYVVTGGLGAVGLEVARWLVRRGAKHVALVSRNATRGAAAIAAELAALQSTGAELTLHDVDVSDRAAVAGFFGCLAREGRVLRGVHHCAGVLDDGVVLQQSRERLERVWAPKARAAWHLHELTRELALDHFVLYSSASAVFGNQGQSSYASANAFLDGLAHARRAAGLPALSVDWGAWAGGGLAAEHEAARQRRAMQGVHELEPALALQTLELLLASDHAQAVVLAVDWKRFARQFDAGPPPLLATLLEAAVEDRSFTERLAELAPEEREPACLNHVIRRARACLGLAEDAPFSSTEPLMNAGLDSMTALELRNALSRDFQLALSAAFAFDYPTVEEIARHLFTRWQDAQLIDALRPVASPAVLHELESFAL